MGWFKKPFSKALSHLVTCILERQGESWDVRWAADGRVPEQFTAHSLITATGLPARDIQGNEISIGGESLEELVLNGETMLPNPAEAMFRWIRRVSELEKN